MKGKYNGVTMKLRYLLPHKLNVQVLSKEAQKKLEWVDWYLAHKRNARLTCRYFGISPDTFYRWWNRFDKRNLLTLEDDKKTRRPKRVRQMTTPFEHIKLVTEIRLEDLEKSKYEIAEELERRGIKLGTSTIQKIINRNPKLLNAQHKSRVRTHRKRSIVRIKAPPELKNKHLGSLTAIDTKHFIVMYRKFYIFCALDSRSRFGYVQAFKTASSTSAGEFLREVVNYFPFRVENIQTDNGSEFLLNFHKVCEVEGIPHFFTDPYCPKQNGRVERFIQTLIYEYLNYQDDLIDDLDEIRRRCSFFNEKYNYRRFHQALGYKTPAEVVQSLSINILT